MPEIFNIDKQTSDKTPKPVKPVTVKTPDPKHKNHFLSAFMVKPDGVRFETQDTSEQVLLLMRRHPITNLGWLLSVGLLFLTPMFIAPLVIQFGLNFMRLPAGYYLILPLIWYLGTFGYALTSFLNWYFNVYIVTNERVVDIDWYGLLYKQLSSTQLTKIQDVTYKQGGILDTFFNFGTVYIQTAGTEPNFEFTAVPKPHQVVEQINQIIEAHSNQNMP